MFSIVSRRFSPKKIGQVSDQSKFPMEESGLSSSCQACILCRLKPERKLCLIKCSSPPPVIWGSGKLYNYGKELWAIENIENIENRVWLRNSFRSGLQFTSGATTHFCNTFYIQFSGAGNSGGSNVQLPQVQSRAVESPKKELPCTV